MPSGHELGNIQITSRHHHHLRLIRFLAAIPFFLWLIHFSPIGILTSFHNLVHHSSINRSHTSTTAIRITSGPFAVKKHTQHLQLGSHMLHFGILIHDFWARSLKTTVRAG